MAVVDASQTEPITVHHELDADFLLNNRTESALQDSASFLAEWGLEVGFCTRDVHPASGDGAQAEPDAAFALTSKTYSTRGRL